MQDFKMKPEIYDSPITGIDTRPLLRLVYMWMGVGLLVTAFVAIFVSQSGMMLSSGLMIGAIIVELILVFVLSAAITKLSPTVAGLMFFAYAALNGFTLSVIFLVYDLGAIYSAFFTTAALFGVMSVIAFTTSIDLSQYRSYFMMGLIGLFIAMIVNMFLQSSGFDFMISIAGVVLFTGLTAYDTQKIKRMAEMPELQETGDITMKLGIMGALTLYLDFINLFLFLLRLFGSRD